MAIKESALSLITSIAQGDWIRAVTSAGASRRVTVANLAKAIVESYTGSSLAGSSQSVKAAIDSLYSNPAVTPTSSVGTISNNCSFKIGNVVFLSLRLTFTGATGAYTQVLSGLPVSTGGGATLFSVKGVKISGSSIGAVVGFSMYPNSATISNWSAFANGDIIDIQGFYVAK